MKLKFLALPLFFAAITPVFAQNLIVNGDFDKPLNREVKFDAAKGLLKNSIFTEDRTWNKCLKLEVTNYLDTKQGKKYTASAYIGGDNKLNGATDKIPLRFFYCHFDNFLMTFRSYR